MSLLSTLSLHSSSLLISFSSVLAIIAKSSAYSKWQSRWLKKERTTDAGLNCIKGASGKVIVDDKGIKDSWKEYMEKPMNEENEWDRKISAGPADCIRLAEVRAVLK